MDKLAEEEEEEALALQKHMAASLEEQDFDAADFEVCLYSWSKGLILQVAGMSKSHDLFSLITYRTYQYFNLFVILIAINNSIV